MILATILLLMQQGLEPPLTHWKIKAVSFQRTYDDLCMVTPHACLGIQPGMVPLTEPRIGTEFAFSVHSNCGGPIFSPYVLIRSRERSNWAGFPLPLSLDVIGIPECFRYVGDGVASVRPYSMTERIQIPDVPELIGQEFFFQAFFRINDWTSSIPWTNTQIPAPPPRPAVRWASTELMIVKVMG